VIEFVVILFFYHRQTYHNSVIAIVVILFFYHKQTYHNFVIATVVILFFYHRPSYYKKEIKKNRSNSPPNIHSLA